MPIAYTLARGMEIGSDSIEVIEAIIFTHVMEASGWRCVLLSLRGEDVEEVGRPYAWLIGE